MGRLLRLALLPNTVRHLPPRSPEGQRRVVWHYWAYDFTSPSLQSLASPSDNLLWLAAAPLVAREGQFVLKYFLLRPYGGEFKRRV